MCQRCRTSKCFAREALQRLTRSLTLPVAAATKTYTRAGVQLRHELLEAAIAGQLSLVGQSVAIVLCAHRFQMTTRFVVCMCSQQHGQLQA